MGYIYLNGGDGNSVKASEYTICGLISPRFNLVQLPTLYLTCLKRLTYGIFTVVIF